jgi:hypothetical protein
MHKSQKRNRNAISFSAPSQGYSTLEEEEGADSDLRRSDYENVKEGVVVG